MVSEKIIGIVIGNINMIKVEESINFFKSKNLSVLDHTEINNDISKTSELNIITRTNLPILMCKQTEIVSFRSLNEKKEFFALVLKKGDSIVIPQILDVVHISGELMNLEGNSISAPFFTRKRANYYVKNFAGGFSKENDRSNTIVVYPNGIAKKSRNYILFKRNIINFINERSITIKNFIDVGAHKGKYTDLILNNFDTNKVFLIRQYGQGVSGGCLLKLFQFLPAIDIPKNNAGTFASCQKTPLILK